MPTTKPHKRPKKLWDPTNKKRKNYFKKPYHFDTKKKLPSKGTVASPPYQDLKKKRHLFFITGSIKQYGYSTSNTARSRRVALGKAIRKEGPKVVWGRLHTQVLYRKNAKKGTARYGNLQKFKTDRRWVSKNFPWSKYAKGGKKK